MSRKRREAHRRDQMSESLSEAITRTSCAFLERGVVLCNHSRTSWLISDGAGGWRHLPWVTNNAAVTKHYRYNDYLLFNHYFGDDQDERVLLTGTEDYAWLLGLFLYTLITHVMNIECFIQNDYIFSNSFLTIFTKVMFRKRFHSV